MRCPYCFNDNSKLMETVKLEDRVKKIHLCFSCGRKFLLLPVEVVEVDAGNNHARG